MKKILLFIVILYSYSFSSTISDMSSPGYHLSFSSQSARGYSFDGPAVYNGYASSNYSRVYNTIYEYETYVDYPGKYGFYEDVNRYAYSYIHVSKKVTVTPNTITDQPNECVDKRIDTDTGFLTCNPETGDFDLTLNPDPLGGATCRDLFQADGVAYACNPNTNEATVIPNSDGVINDNGEDVPNCNEGYESTSVASITVGGSGEVGYTQYGCAAVTGTGDIPTTGDGGGSGTGSTDPVTVHNPDGSTTMTMPDGTTYNTTGDGSVTITYPDGTQTSSSGGATSSTGGSGSGGSGTGASTPTETGETGTDTPYEPSPVSTSCSSSALTLQEKMLCELNEGMKNQNSEGNPANSLNNLLKDLNADNNKTGEAINKNIKSTNDNLDLVNKNITETNKNLQAIAAKENASNVYLNNMDKNISDIKNSINDDSFSNTASSDALDGMSSDNESIFSSVGEAYDNVSTAFTGIKENYSSLKGFVDGKSSSDSSLILSSSSLPKKTITIFGESMNVDCFFNQDLNTLFAPIRPFITFILNIFFAYLSIKLFMNFALKNNAGA